MISNKRYFAYVRVSTQRQGHTGTSLAEQREAIDRYAKTWGLNIVNCYEETETAARQGRPVFLDMLKALKAGKARGAVIHKIDRGARNLKDWADLGSLIDAGIEVHFANENLDLNSRGGRLSADIQAVVAADYIRNLREEVRKGFYGRLKQGYYPMPAPLGYIDAGKAKPKLVDPLRGPLIRQAFELYATGEHSLRSLEERMFESGLRTKNKKRVTKNTLNLILRNPFYVGLMPIKSTGHTFVGKHAPLISTALFDAVQGVFAGKRIRKRMKHFFIFRRHIICQACGRALVAEHQKSFIYYRCQKRGCVGTCLREDRIERSLLRSLAKLELNDDEYAYLKDLSIKTESGEITRRNETQKRLHIELQSTGERLSKLAEAYIDGVFSKEAYRKKESELLLHQRSIEERLETIKRNETISITDLFDAFLELANSACLTYKSAAPAERRDLVKALTSNFLFDGKSLTVKLEKPFSIIAERPPVLVGGAHQDTGRTPRQIWQRLHQYLSKLDISKSDDALTCYLRKPKLVRPNDIRILQARRAQSRHKPALSH